MNMTTLKKCTWLFMVMLLCNCGKIENEELTGVYDIKGYNNTIDTLKIFDDGTYDRSLYAKGDKSLIYKHKGVWYRDEDRIVLKNYIENYDQKSLINKKQFDHLLISCSFPIRKWFGKVYLGNNLEGSILYEKL